jgi:hypothetical protein
MLGFYEIKACIKNIIKRKEGFDKVKYLLIIIFPYFRKSILSQSLPTKALWQTYGKTSILKTLQ